MVFLRLRNLKSLLVLLELELNLRSLLLLIAMVQGIVIAVLLLWRGFRQRRVEDYFLAGLLCFLTFSLIEHFLGFMGVYDNMRERGQDITFFPFSNKLTWGPLIWYYVLGLTDGNFRWKRRYYGHFLPALLYYAFHLGVWGLPPSVKGSLFGQLWFWQISLGVEIAFYLLAFWYLWMVLRRYQAYRQLVDAEYSNTSQIMLTWLRNFIYGFFIYLCFDLVFNLIGLVSNFGYNDAYWLELIRAIHLYYISVTGWAFAQKTIVPFHVLEKSAPIADAAAGQTEPSTAKVTGKTPISSETLEVYRHQLAQFMEKEQPWLDAELTLSQLATKISLNTSQLSYLINSGFDKNFNDFVNNYRVEAVKQKMRDPALAHLSLLGVAFECGFNSKATFNRAFKKNTGASPSAYLK